jgi:hypothetical protein
MTKRSAGVRVRGRSKNRIICDLRRKICQGQGEGQKNQGGTRGEKCLTAYGDVF